MPHRELIGLIVCESFTQGHDLTQAGGAAKQVHSFPEHTHRFEITRRMNVHI